MKVGMQALGLVQMRLKNPDGGSPRHGAALERTSGRPGLSGSSSRAKVLVVDDHEDLADALAAMLEMEGMQAKVAHDGEAALALAGSFMPDLVVLDINMPRLDGYQVARALRAQRDQQLILLALSALPRYVGQPKAYAAGFDLYIEKPTDFADIYETIRHHLNTVMRRASF